MPSATIVLDLAEVEYRLECQQEDIPVRGHAMASGDDDADRECEDEILAALERGNQWAWCCVKVTAILGPFHGTEYLGACSYDSEAAFRNDAYYAQMCADALVALKESIIAAGGTIDDSDIRDDARAVLDALKRE